MTVRSAARSLINASVTVLEDGHTIIDSMYGSVVKTTWSGLLNGDSGSPVTLVQFSDRSIQVEGTFGAGGTLVVEGSNDGVNYHVLTDPTGSALSVVSAAIKAVTESVQFIRPRVTAGDGTTSLVVTMSACRSA